MVRAAVSVSPRRSSGRVASSNSRAGSWRRGLRTRGMSIQNVEHGGDRRDARPVPVVEPPERPLSLSVDEDRLHADPPRALELVVGAVADEDRLVRLDSERLAAGEVDPRVRLREADP